MTDAKNEAARGASTSDAELCPVCRGNDGDTPCAYPGDGIEGCLREARMKIWREQEDPKCFDGGDACIDCLCMGQCIAANAGHNASGEPCGTNHSGANGA